MAFKFGLKGLNPFHKKKAPPLLPLLLIVLALAFGGYYLWTNSGGGGGGKTPGQGETQKPPPTPLKKGKGEYNISQSNPAGPRIFGLSLDPLDPKKGREQTVVVQTSYTSPIEKVEITLQSDNLTQDLPPLTLASGTAYGGGWQVTWTVNDTVLYKYILTITSTGSDGEKSSVVVAPRQ